MSLTIHMILIILIMIIIITHNAQNTQATPSWIIRSNWNDAEKISIAPVQGSRAQTEKCQLLASKY